MLNATLRQVDASISSLSEECALRRRHPDQDALPQATSFCLCSLFLVTGKKHYFDIGLNIIDQRYNSIPFKILQLTRTNRTVPLNKGKNSRGIPMAEWAMDAVIESLMR
jgi:hypothetical protein